MGFSYSFLVFVPMFSGGCSSFVETDIKSPGWLNLHQNIEIIDKNDLSTITNIIYVQWNKDFGFGTKEEIIFKEISNLEIIWVDKINSYEEHTQIFSVTESPKSILINLDFQENFIRLYTHEFVHLVLWSINGEPDPDHEKEEYQGWTNEHTEWIRVTELFIENIFDTTHI